MIFEVISAVAISVTVSFFMSLGIAYVMHKRISIMDVNGLKIILDGKADSRHIHHKEDIINVEDVFRNDYAEAVEMVDRDES